jgi:hypothetical protein
MSTFDKILLTLLAISILTPRIPVLGLGLLGALRLDHILVSLTFIVVLFKLVGSSRYILYFCLFSFIFLLGENSRSGFANVAGTIYSVFFIIQWMVYFEIGVKVSKTREIRWLKSIFVCLIVNSFLAFISNITGFTVCSEYLNGSILTEPCLLDRYGLSGAPYVFGAHMIALIFISLLFINVTYFWLGLTFLVIGDSRAFFGAFIPSISLQFLKSSKGFSALLPFLLIPVVLIIGGGSKVLNGFSYEQLTDRSLGMRLDNYFNFLDWLDIKRLFIGDGYASYLQFAVQYDQPGHPDNLYIRTISEIGLLGVFLFSIIIFSITRRYGLKLTNRSFIFIMGVLVLGLVQESHLASKSGQIIALLSGLSFINFKALNRRNVNVG